MDKRNVIMGVRLGSAYLILCVVYFYALQLSKGNEAALAALATVTSVMEPTFGATVNKCVCNIGATIIGGFVGYGAHLIAVWLGSNGETAYLAAFTFIIVVFFSIVRNASGLKNHLLDNGVSTMITAIVSASVSTLPLHGLLRQITINKIWGLLLGVAISLTISVLPPFFSRDDLRKYLVEYMDALASFHDGLEELLEEGEFDSKKVEAFMELHKAVVKSQEKDISSMMKNASWESFTFPSNQYKKVGLLCGKIATSFTTTLSDAVMACSKDKTLVSDWSSNATLRKACMGMCLESAKALRDASLSLKTKTGPSPLIKDHLSFALNHAAHVNVSRLERHSTYILSMVIESVSTVEQLVGSVDELAQALKYPKPAKEEGEGKETAINIDSIDLVALPRPVGTVLPRPVICPPVRVPGPVSPVPNSLDVPLNDPPIGQVLVLARPTE